MERIIAIPLVEKGFLSPEEIVQEHVNKLEEQGSVYFSTDARMSADKVKMLKSLVLFTRDKVYELSYDTYDNFGKDKGVPKDSKTYSPSIYSDVKRVHWFKVTEIREMSESEISELGFVNSDLTELYGDFKHYLEQSGRYQVVYLKREG